MANDYEGSLAQNFIKYGVTTEIAAAVGENFQSVVVFVPENDAIANFVTPPGIGLYQVASSSNFASVALGTLLDWLTEFFATTSITKVYVVEIDDTTSITAGLTAAMLLYKSLGFFKLLLSSTASEQVEFATVMALDTELTQAWIGTAEAACLDPESTTSLAHLLISENLKPHLEYHATAHNSAMAQLGLTLATLNESGFAVGESLDMKATSIIDGSGAAGANLGATDVQDLIDQNIGFWATLGNNTGQVAQHGGKLLDGSLAGADWFVKFFEYMCAVDGVTYLTQAGTSHSRNDQTYQALLAILQARVSPFVNIGKIGGFKITAPRFSKLVNTGSSFIVPNAWSATFNDNVRSVNIQGKLAVVVSA
jgi:hypothetical protein